MRAKVKAAVLAIWSFGVLGGGAGQAAEADLDCLPSAETYLSYDVTNAAELRDPPLLTIVGSGLLRGRRAHHSHHIVQHRTSSPETHVILSKARSAMLVFSKAASPPVADARSSIFVLTYPGNEACNLVVSAFALASVEVLGGGVQDRRLRELERLLLKLLAELQTS